MNNKAFAISSMLYGILTVTIVLLASLLTVLSSGNKIKIDLSDNLNENLDKCAKRRAILNSCYMDTNNCKIEHSNYHTCLGIKDGTTVATGTSPAEFSTNLLQEEITKLIKLEDEERRYFVGDNPDNYILYEGKKGRIIYFEKDGTMKIIFEDQNMADNLIAFDITTGKDPNTSAANLWTGSKIYNYLNEDFLYQFSNPQKFLLKTWYVGPIYQNNSFDGEEGHYTREKLDAVKARVGLASVVDLAPISTNANCLLVNPDGQASSIASTCNKNNWALSSTTTWLINTIADPQANIRETFAYIWGANTSLNYASKSNNTKKVEPVVYLKDVYFQLGGNGKITTPYVLQ